MLENQAQLDELKSEQKEIEQTLRDAQYTFDSHKRARVELQERIPGLEVRKCMKLFIIFLTFLFTNQHSSISFLIFVITFV